MPYRDIKPPIVGDKQVLRVNGQDVLIDLQTYLGYLNDNLNVGHGDLSPIFINGVVGETFTIPIMSTANGIMYNSAGYYAVPVVFPTAGTIRKTIVTGNNPGIITVMAQGVFVCVTGEGNVNPLFAVRLEKQNKSGAWERQPFWENYEIYTTQAGTAYTTTGVVTSGSFLHFIPDVLPNTTYRVTLLAGTSRVTALPQTGQWRVDATGTNTFEFNAWGN